jgi:sugar lactone lactonase YvrE
MPYGTSVRLEIRTLLITAVLGLTGIVSTFAHPGSGIAVDSQGQIYFVDTGQGVWRMSSKGELALIHKVPYHWMALDEKGHYADAQTLGSFDGGAFERATPAGSLPALVISSDYPIVVGQEGGLYYVPFDAAGQRQLIRRMPDGSRSVFALLPADNSSKPMQWVNGIAAGPDGSLYVTDHDVVRRIDPRGAVFTVRSINLKECGDPLPGAPKLPYLRGLAVARDGTIYAAANGCRAVIAVAPKGAVRTVLKAERPWSPTGVAVFGSAIYVLEYLHTLGEDRREWVPRVRRIGRDGTITTLTTIQREKK